MSDKQLHPGPVIRQIRREKGMQQLELAQLAGIKQPNLSRIECALVHSRPQTLQKIAQALGCELLDFYDVSRHSALAHPGTVYVVTTGEYSDYSLRGIFSTREKADELAALLRDANDVAEWD